MALQADFIKTSVRILPEDPMNSFLLAMMAKIVVQHFFGQNQIFGQIFNDFNEFPINFVFVVMLVMLVMGHEYYLSKILIHLLDKLQKLCDDMIMKTNTGLTLYIPSDSKKLPDNDPCGADAVNAKIQAALSELQ